MYSRRFLIASSAFILSSLPAACGVLQNQYFRVVICEDWEGTHPPGSILEFCDLEDTLGNIFDEADYAAKVRAGNYALSAGLFQVLSDSEGIFVSPSMSSSGLSLPARVSLWYRLTSQGLNIAWRVDCDQPITFNDGLNLDFDLSPWNILKGFNQAGQVDSFQVASIGSEKIRALHAGWQLSDSFRSLWILQPDPFQARWSLTASKLRQQWLHSRLPNTTLPASQFPKVASTLDPFHSIWGDLSLEITGADVALPAAGQGWMHLSAMPDGAEQGLIFMWDELPWWPDTFEPMTTATNPATPMGSKVIALLQEHPAMKNVLLLGMDKQLSWYPFAPNLPYWSVPQSFVCIDTIDQIEGSGALTVSHYDSRATWVTQSIPCTPGETLNLSGYVKVDSIAAGWAGITLQGDSIGIQPLNLVFTSPRQWTFCEAEFSAGPNSILTVQAGMMGGPGKVCFDDLRLERPGTPANLLTNAGFNNFSFNVWYDGEGLQWWHAHAYRRIATEAPPDYLDFLKRVESGTPQYGWEDRTQLQMHCYHHTASELYPLGPPYSHEFNFYDPAADSGRFYMLERDLVESGLSPQESFTVFRFPSHKHQMSAVVQCIKHGIKLIDRGQNYDKNCFLGFIIQPEGVLWETNSNWWSDADSWLGVDSMRAVLDRGELILVGGHPLSTFPTSDPTQFAVVSGVFSDLEERHPHMKYLFPDEFADLCEQSRTWWDVASRTTPSGFEFSFYGAATKGQTVVAHLLNLYSVIFTALVDGQPTTAQIRGNRVFIELPNLPLGEHLIVLLRSTIIPQPMAQFVLPDQVHFGQPFPNPCNAMLIFPVELPQASRIEYRLFDVIGRMVLFGDVEGDAGTVRIPLTVNGLPSGIYVYTIQTADQAKQGTLSILK